MVEPARSAESFGALLRPVEMRTGGQLIAERLVTAIALGEFEPGQRLPAERELAATLEVSRTTVREALQRLHAGGYVVTTRIRREVGLGFDAEPYTPQMRQRALRQHPVLAEAVIAGNPARAAKQAASHFSLTESALAEVRACLTLRTGDTDAHPASERRRAELPPGGRRR